MIKVKNNTDETLMIPGFPAFGPREVRKVTREEADYLLRNPNVTEEEEKKITGQDKRPPKNGKDQ